MKSLCKMDDDFQELCELKAVLMAGFVILSPMIAFLIYCLTKI